MNKPGLTTIFALLFAVATIFTACGEKSSSNNGSNSRGSGTDTSATNTNSGGGENTGDAATAILGTWSTEETASGEMLMFKDDGTYWGSDGKEEYGGKYSIEGDKISLDGAEASTFSVSGDGQELKIGEITYQREPDSAADADEGLIEVIGDNVNVRTKPSTDAKVAFQLDKSLMVYRIERSTFFETIGKKTDYWYKISNEVEGGAVREGWIFGAFLASNLENEPLTERLKFKGAGMGDYYHCSFEWPGGEGYGWKCDRYYMAAEGLCDFGYGEAENSTGEYNLMEDSEKLEGKEFMVTYGVAMLDVFEGDGSMETIKMQVPVIHDMKPVE